MDYLVKWKKDKNDQVTSIASVSEGRRRRDLVFQQPYLWFQV